MNSQECKTIRYHKNNRKSFTKEGRSSVTSHNLDYPDPAHFLQPRSCPSPSPSLVSVISPSVSVFPLIWVPVSVHLIPSPVSVWRGFVVIVFQKRKVLVLIWLIVHSCPEADPLCGGLHLHEPSCLLGSSKNLNHP